MFEKSGRPDMWIGRLTQIVAIGACVLLASCAYPIRNQPLSAIDDRQGYRSTALQDNGHSDTLVIVSASGGGTRAAALELSILRAMDQIKLAGDKTLADEIDVLSSVSGGSVTAAYFAWKGKAGLNTLENDFIRQDGIAALARSGLNPVALAKLSTPAKERIDVLIDYLDDRLFKDANGKKDITFQTLLDQHRTPFLVLNAGDMVEGVPFAFTQENFDLLCSDLAKVKLSTAVAASAAFPVALSPVTLKNYSHCAAEDNRQWPPLWVTNDANTDWYVNPARTMRGRVAKAYALGSSATGGRKDYIHLLDGGIADNLGISEPIRYLTTTGIEPSYINDIAQGRITKIVFIMINARSFPASDLDHQQATPGVLSMLLSVIDSGIDETAFGNAARLRTLLNEEFGAYATQFAAAPQVAARFKALSEHTYLLPIDFDAIDRDDCRQNFHEIGTSWTLAKQQIDALLVAGKALLGSAREFHPMLDGIGAHVDGPLPTLDDACAAIAKR